MKNTTAMDPSGCDATPLQAGMVFNALAHPDAGVDIQQVAIDFEEALDVDRFIQAWQVFCRHYPILRTSFAWEGAIAPRQVIHDEVTVPVSRVDWSGLDVKDMQAARLAEERVRGFAMDVAPLMRLTIARLADDHWWVLWTFHHALLDGRSFHLVLERVFAVYDGLSAAPEPPKPAFDVYVDTLAAIDQTEALENWRLRLASIDSPTSIDTPYRETRKDVIDRKGPAVLPVEASLSAQATAALKDFAHEAGVSLNNVVQAAWSLLLHHYSQQSTVVFGTTRAGRHVVEGSEEMIGLLINTVPFVVTLSPDDTVIDVLQKVRREQQALRAIETTPLTEIQAVSDLGTTPVFDNIVMFDEATLNSRMAERLGERASSRTFFYYGQTNFDLTLLAYAEPEMVLRLEYNRDRHDEAAASRVLRQLINLLTAMPAGRDQKAVVLDYLTDDEQQKLAAWNATDNDWDLDTTLMALFERQVALTPDADALVFRGATLTYRTFNERANQLAHYLREVGVRPDQLVGLAVERSFEMELGIYGIIKAGGAFVPLDPDLPKDRLAFMAEDAGVALILTQSHLLPQLPENGPDIIALDGDQTPFADYPETNPEIITRPDQLAYALFTSGSTGTPKCAMNEHRGIVNRLLWMQDAFKLDAGDTVLQKTPYSFDVSVWEHFWPLQMGARLVMAEPGGHRDPAYLAEIIQAEGVTTIHFVPSMLQLFVEEPNVAACSSIRRVIASGEALPRELQDRLFQILDTELHNLYGPTEAAIDVTWWACDAKSLLSTVPIGRAIANTQIHILDKQMRALPLGAAGELYIGGVQVGRGYLNRDELTADRFVDDPHQAGMRLYKTGDLARFMPDGNVEYLGRLDHQVKIHGLRIELGEIEAVISRYDNVREVVVVAREDRPGQQMLVAYVVGDGIEVERLRQHVGQFLADYMVPSEWVTMAALPLNNSGKVDRKRLPAPAIAPRKDIVQPSTDAEQKVIAVWHQVLGHEDVGVGDTFFAVGGSSLSVIRLAHRLAEAFGREVRVADLMRFTTITQQAKHLAGQGDAKDEKILSGIALARQQKDARQRRRRAQAQR